MVFQTDNAASLTFHPFYDGNGNLMSLRATSGVIAAGYEYGPFGELLLTRGGNSGKNPFRFSTKFTDSETGLVYYGYRYYNADTGRWLGRDPSGESGGANRMAFVSNRSVTHIDAHGLREIPVEFNAFINGDRRGRWLPEPGGRPLFPIFPSPDASVREFSSDWRDFGESNHNLANPNSRVMSRAIIESSLIGTRSALILSGTQTGLSHRRWRPGRDDAITIDELGSGVETARASVGGMRQAQERRLGPCYTTLRFAPSATYPFNIAAPSIDYNVTFHFKVFAPGWVTIGLSGSHNRFPDYEAYFDDDQGYGWFSPSTGPGIGNLNQSHRIEGDRDGIHWYVSTMADTPCDCPEGD